MTEKRLRILLVGARGTLGRAVASELGLRHEVIPAGRSSGDIRLDITDSASIKDAFAQAGKLDAVVSAAGDAAFLPLSDIRALDFDESAYALGLKSKLMGQVNLSLVARDVLGDSGSITLTTGILSRIPIVAGSSSSMVNGALESWVMAAAIEFPRGIRINVVSPGVLEQSMNSYGAFFRGFEAVPAARAALAFSRSVEGRQTGQVYRVL